MLLGWSPRTEDRFEEEHHHFYCNCGSDRCELGVRLRIVFCVWG